jgi:hypothetical protein
MPRAVAPKPPRVVVTAVDRGEPGLPPLPTQLRPLELDELQRIGSPRAFRHSRDVAAAATADAPAPSNTSLMTVDRLMSHLHAAHSIPDRYSHVVGTGALAAMHRETDFRR